MVLPLLFQRIVERNHGIELGGIFVLRRVSRASLQSIGLPFSIEAMRPPMMLSGPDFLSMGKSTGQTPLLRPQFSPTDYDGVFLPRPAIQLDDEETGNGFCGSVRPSKSGGRVSASHEARPLGMSISSLFLLARSSRRTCI